MDKKRKIGSIQWGLIVLSCFLSIIIENNKAEIYIFMSCSVAILISYAIAHNGKIRFRFTLYHQYILLFCAFCYISSIWAANKTLSVGKANTVLEIFILMSAIYLCIDFDGDPINKLLKAIMWAGYFASVYVILSYGFATVLSLLRSNARFDNSLINANGIGMMGAYSLLVTIYFILYEGYSLWNLMSIPTAIVVLGSASRKAFIILIVGVTLLFVFKNRNSRSLLKKILGTVFVIAGSLVLLFFVSRLRLMEYIVTRFQNMFTAFAGGTNADNSSLTRLRLISLGINIFRENPLFGVGMDNATMYVAGIFSKDYYYLHNNYIEMLADGGVIGFAIYYIFYIKLLTYMLRHKDFGDREFNITFILLILLLLMDLGQVSYYSKERYVLLMIIYFTCQQLKSKSKTVQG